MPFCSRLVLRGRAGREPVGRCGSTMRHGGVSPASPAGRAADTTVTGRSGGGRPRHTTDFTAPLGGSGGDHRGEDEHQALYLLPVALATRSPALVQPGGRRIRGSRHRGGRLRGWRVRARHGGRLPPRAVRADPPGATGGVRACPGPRPGHAPGRGVSPLLVVLVLPVAVAGAVCVEGELGEGGQRADSGEGGVEGSSMRVLPEWCRRNRGVRRLMGDDCGGGSGRPGVRGRTTQVSSGPGALCPGQAGQHSSPGVGFA